MSINVTRTSIVLASVDRILLLAAENFKSGGSVPSFDSSFYQTIFSASSHSELVTVEQHFFRVLLQALCFNNQSLVSCFVDSPGDGKLSAGLFWRDSNCTANKLATELEFCKLCLKQLLDICISESSPISIQRFYRFTESLAEYLAIIRHSHCLRFLEILLNEELELDTTNEILISLVLLSSSIPAILIRSVEEYLRRTFSNLLEAFGDSNAKVFNYALSPEFLHQLFISLSAPQVVEILAVERQIVSDFLSELEKELNARHLLLPSSLAHFVPGLNYLKNSTELDENEHLNPFDYIDIDNKDLNRKMDSLAFQNANLLAQQIQEIGVSFTSSTKICRQHLTALNAIDSQVLNSMSVSRVIVMMMNTTSPNQSTMTWDQRSSISAGNEPAGPGSCVSADNITAESTATAVGTSVNQNTSATWNSKIFVNIVKDLVPNLNWSQVVVHLDQPAMYVRNKTQLQFLTSVLNEGLGCNPFPIALIFRDWNFHKAAQFSWIEQIILHPDVFCFADYPHQVVNTSALKMQLEESRDLSNWYEIFVIGVLGFLQQPPITNLRCIICQTLISVLISNHLNPNTVLNLAWNCEELNKTASFRLRDVIKTSLCNYYLKSPDDQAKLIRILEVAHELKPNGLAELFNMQQFAFTIDLACLASRRDYLKLDKWIDDKLLENGDFFAANVISYIRHRLSSTLLPSKINLLPQETLKILINALSRATSLSANTTADLQQLFTQISQLQLKSAENRVANIPTSTCRLPNTASNSSLFGGTPGTQSTNTFGGGYAVGSSGFGSTSREHVFAAAATQQLQNRQQQQQQQQQSAITSSVPMFGGVPNPSNISGSSPNLFSQAADILKVSSQTNILQPNFGGNGHPMSMSPSGQMMRTTFVGSSGSPVAQSRPNPNVGWNIPTNLPGNAPLRTTPGPSIDFRSQIPPGSPGGSFGLNAGALQQQVVDHSLNRMVMSSVDDLISVNFSEDIQNEANMFFQKIYSQSAQLSVNEFVSHLKYLKNSIIQKERDILSCIIKNLFEEYRFFHDYPERELRTTAEVYGSLIREGVVTNLQFATAMRRMIESLQAEQGSMLWTFGIVALNACRMKLREFPRVCIMIANQASFLHFPQNLKDYVTAGMQCQLPSTHGRETPTWQQQTMQQRQIPSVTDSKGSIRSSHPDTDSNIIKVAGEWIILDKKGQSVLSATSVDTLVNATEKEGTQIKEPPECAMEKVAFLFNNLTITNIDRKMDDFKQLIDENGDEFLRWLAQYLVMKRVSIEYNFHGLYYEFLDAIDNKPFYEYVKAETFRNIKILLRSDKRQAASNYGDRQLLRNLGSFLGGITIAKDCPVVATDLDIKLLIMEAYYKGQQELLYVIPFIAKIIVFSKKSQIFGPSCAWLRAIFKILAELFTEPDLKLNLRFEIELLSKELSLDLSKVETDGVLKDTERLVKLPQQLGDLKALKPPEVQSNSTASPVQTYKSGTESMGEPTSTTLSRGTHDLDSAGSQSPNAQVQIPAHFHYHDINVVSFDGLTPHVKLSASLPLFQLNPQLKHVVRPALNHAVKELIGPVTERAIRIAMHVTEHICKKDFALDPDEQRLRRASHHMIRAMTAGMAAITSRDPLTNAIQGYLKQAFINAFRGTPITPEQQKFIDEAASTITEDNVELTTNFIVKTACEKATPEVDKRLDGEFAIRKQCRAEGRVYTDPVAQAQAQQMPKKISLRSGGITQQQMVVYDEFSSRICGFKPTTAEDMIVDFNSLRPSTPTTVPSHQHLEDKHVENFVQQLQVIVRDADMSLNSFGVPHYRATTALAAIRDGISQLAANPREPVQQHNCIQRLVEQMLFAYRNPESLQQPPEVEWNRRLKDMFIQVCRLLLLQLSLTELSKRITRIIIDCRLDYRFNVDAMDLFAKHMLIQLNIYDQHLAMQMDNNNFEALVFAQRFLKVLNAIPQMRIADAMPLTIEQLTKLQQYGPGRPTPDSFTQGEMTSRGATNLPPTTAVSERLHTSLMPNQMGNAASHMLTTRLVDNTEPDASELQSKVEMILRDWIQMCHTPLAQKDPQQALANIVHVMHQQGVLSTDDMITRFFRLCTEMCVDVSYRLLKNEANANQTTVVRQRCYYTLDAFVKLTCLMIKHSDGSQYQTKVNLLKKVLNIVTNVLHLDHEVRGPDFHAMPYQRILIIMFNELTTPDPILDAISWNILEAFGQALFILQPRRVPGFAYAWLDIIGHRNFIGRLLKDSSEPLKTAAMYTQLIICHLKFLAPFLRNIHLPKTIAMMYKGTLRVLLVILHDFPELLCEYHIVICDTIPPNCVQLRNLVLSAYPKNMRLPDPFGQNLRMDGLIEMTQEPKMHINMATIIPGDIRTQLDDYLNTRSSVDFHANLPGLLQVSNVSGSKYNTTIINALVIYVGMRAIQAIHEKQQTISMTTIAHTSYMDIFQNLTVSLCTEGRYLLFNAIANQLRYPNSHTHYFSCTLLYLFLESNSEVVKEQITRILFERLVALRPHPWGLLITFIELIRNKSYGFWNHEFVRCAPEIERLFNSVANSCANKHTQGTPQAGQGGDVSHMSSSPQTM